MDSKPKRHWFQLHLSTAVIILIISGLFTGPAVVIYTQEERRVALFKSAGRETEADWISAELVYCFFVFLPVLIASAVSCERHIRRREARKP